MQDFPKKTRVLLIYTELLEYRIPVFSELGRHYELTVTHSGPKMTCSEVGFREITLPRFRLWKFHYQRGLRTLISSGSYDAIVFFMDIGWLSTVLEFIFCPVYARKVIWGLWRTGRAIPDAIRLALAKRADCNVFYSRNAANDFISLGLKPNQIFVALNTFRIDKPMRNESTVRDSILCVGSLNPRKEHDLTIAAFFNIAGKISDRIRLVFVGNGPELSRLRELSKNSPFYGQVEFYKACHDEDVLRGFYDRAICSVSFGQAGLSVLQSFAYGVPFITKEGAISGGEIENIVNGFNGYLCEPSQEGLEDVIALLIGSKKKAAEMGRNALHYYKTKATVDAMISGFISAIDGGQYSGAEI